MFIKLMNDNDIHHDFQYIEGINKCENYDLNNRESGLHFTDNIGFHRWISFFKSGYYRQVISHFNMISVKNLQNRANYKAETIELGPKKHISELLLDETFTLKAIKEYPETIYYIKNPSLEMKMVAIDYYKGIIGNIEMDDELKEKLVSKNGHILKWFKGEIPFWLQQIAVNQNGRAIKWIRNPSYFIHELSIKQILK